MTKLEKLREKIDILDNKLIKLIALRMKFSMKVYLEKKKLGLPSLSKARWNEVKKNVQTKARDFKLNKTMVNTIWEAFHEAGFKQRAEFETSQKLKQKSK